MSLPLTNEFEEYKIENVKYQLVLSSPKKISGYHPEDLCEVYVRKIPSDATMKELFDFFKSSGEIFDIRLMMQGNLSKTRNMAYVQYMDFRQANIALKNLSHVEFRTNCCLQIEKSFNNRRIYVGGIPLTKNKDQIWQELNRLGFTNIVDIIMYRSYSEKYTNRGYVFVEFRTHEEAAHFRAKADKRLVLWGMNTRIDWSVPYLEPSWDEMKQVNVIHLLNLDVTETYEDVYRVVVGFIEPTKVEKVFKFKNYAFVHLKSRQYAEDLMIKLKHYYEFTVVQVSWAKPPNKYTKNEYRQYKVNQIHSKQYKKKSQKYTRNRSALLESPCENSQLSATTSPSTVTHVENSLDEVTSLIENMYVHKNKSNWPPKAYVNTTGSVLYDTSEDVPYFKPPVSILQTSNVLQNLNLVEKGINRKDKVHSKPFYGFPLGLNSIENNKNIPVYTYFL